jgi:hypothetical protein
MGYSWFWYLKGGEDEIFPGVAIHFRGEAHSFVMKENGAEKCSKMALSLAADVVFGNYWWYAFNTNVYFRGYINVATLTFVHKTRGQTGG